MKKEELKGIISYLEEMAKDLNVQKDNLYLSMQELKYRVDVGFIPIFPVIT